MRHEDFDRDIQAALAVDPSPQFVARVRTAIANQPVTGRFPSRWALASVSAFMVAIAIAGGLKQGEVARLKPRPTEITAGLQPSTTNEGQATNEPTANTREAVVPTLRSAGVKELVFKEPAMPEVLIAPEDTQAFQQLLISVSERRFEASFDENVPPTPWEMTELTVPPITIEPLETPAANN